MASVHHHFQALLKNVNPQDTRASLASSLPNDVRAWLKEHEFATAAPHTRLSGSYARDTAIGTIKDVDVLLFLTKEQLDRTPNAVLLDLKKVLDEYPDAALEASGQRRSIHLEFPQHDLHLDIVPVVAENGSGRALKVPDRSRQEWIDSDPLGYAASLTTLNQKHGQKVIPLIKLVKAWRDEQMITRRPKSYVLEVMVYHAVNDTGISLIGNSPAQNFADFVAYVTTRYQDLMDDGHEAPRICDPQTGARISAGWERPHFETFMRRAREADTAAQKALAAETIEDAIREWKLIFGSFWPIEDQVKSAARAEASSVIPGVTGIAAAGFAVGTMARSIGTRPTTYHGDR
ncbi:MAG TPA: nucleotidyltransferase [Vicinamibacterales bacterium]|nr:nucleotidyltransferase [Vicinamibacterales bacterium]